MIKHSLHITYDPNRMNSYDVFVEVVELKSFSAAAKKLHRSPSAISKQISQLEQKFDVQFFNRTTRTLAITEAGKLFYDRCKDMSRRMDDAESELKDLSKEPGGRIKITWPNVLSSSRVISVLADFLAKYPDIKVDIEVTPAVLNLTEERIDFAFRLGALSDSTMVAIELFKLSPVICCTPDVISRFGKPDSMDDIFQLPHIIPSFLNIGKMARQQLPAMKALNPEEHCIVNNLSAIYNMTKQGIGASVLFRHVIERELEEGSLIDLTVNNKLPEIPVFLVYPKLSYTPKKLRCFIDFFKEQLKY